MTTPARSDFPPIRTDFGETVLTTEHYTWAIDEIDHLRRWQREAAEVITRWNLLYDECYLRNPRPHPRPHPLGVSKTDDVRAYIADLEARLSGS